MPKIHDLAAIYVRVSTQKESQKDSPEHQKGICEEKARELKIEVIKPHYEDRDTGTSIIARSSIQKLIQDAKNGLFSTVIFASLSRFSRDQLDALTLKRTLVDALGIRVVSIDENYDSLIDTDEFKFQVISAVNQKLSEQISLSSKRGIRQSALSGNYIGSKNPYGYKKVIINNKKTLEIVPEEAEIVKEIFTRYIDGEGVKKIVNWLNEDGVKTRKGGLWAVSTVGAIIDNPLYCGEYYFGKYKVKKIYDDLNNLSDRRKKLIAADKREWELSEKLKFESIITKDMYNIAQKVKSNRADKLNLNTQGKRSGGSRAKKNIFTGILFCKCCNSPISSVKNKVYKGIEYRYLICSARRRQGVKACTNSIRLRQEIFEEHFFNEISERLRKALVSFRKANNNYGAVSKNSETVKNNNTTINKLEVKINENRKLLQGIRKLFLLEEIDEKQYYFEKESYENDIAQLQHKIDILKNEEENSLETEYVISSVENALTTIDIILHKKDKVPEVDKINLVLKSVIKKITLDENGSVEIYSILD